MKRQRIGVKKLARRISENPALAQKLVYANSDKITIRNMQSAADLFLRAMRRIGPQTDPITLPTRTRLKTKSIKLDGLSGYALANALTALDSRTYTRKAAASLPPKEKLSELLFEVTLNPNT